MLVVFCSKCGKRLQVDNSLAGAKCRCPACLTVVTVPADAQSTDAATAITAKPRPAAPVKRPPPPTPPPASRKPPAKPIKKAPPARTARPRNDVVEDIEDFEMPSGRSRGRNGARKPGKSSWGVIAILGGGALAVVITVAVAGVLWFTKRTPEAPAVAAVPLPGDQPVAPPVVPPVVPPVPPPEAKPIPPQPKPVQDPPPVVEPKVEPKGDPKMIDPKIDPKVDPKIPQPVPIAGQPLAEVLPINLKNDEAAEFPKPPKIELKPAALVGDAMDLKLTSTVASVAVGAGGRYLVLNQPKEKQLSVFDCEQAKIVKVLPVGGDGTQIAGGHDALIVANPAASRIERWSLTTFALESFAPLQPGDTVTSMTMGSTSIGPLAVAMRSGNQTSLLLLHPQTFKPSALAIENNRGLGPAPLHSSADGRTIVQGTRVWWRLGQSFKSFQSPEACAPGPEGLTLFGKGQVRLVDGRPLHQNTSAHGRAIWYVPAVQGGVLFLSMNQVMVPGNSDVVPGKKVYLEADFHIFGNLRPIATLEKVNGNEGLVDWWSGKHQPFEQYVFYVPDANLLAILPTSRDRLFLHKVDFDTLRKDVK